LTSRIERLHNRVDRIEKTETPEWRARAEGRARTSWVVDHLSADEERQVIEAIKAHEADPSTANEEAGLAILRKGEQRAATEPPSVWEQYKAKWMRVETLGMVGRPPTEAEALERQELTLWLDDFRARLEAKLNERFGAGAI
jgi:hypothetical protein